MHSLEPLLHPVDSPPPDGAKGQGMKRSLRQQLFLLCVEKGKERGKKREHVRSYVKESARRANTVSPADTRKNEGREGPSPRGEVPPESRDREEEGRGRGGGRQGGNCKRLNFDHVGWGCGPRRDTWRLSRGGVLRRWIRGGSVFLSLGPTHGCQIGLCPNAGESGEIAHVPPIIARCYFSTRI